MTRRPGMTMTEVMVTIFVVSIGLSGVMAMFPFGARQMQDVLVSDRSTSHATSIDGLIRGYWKEQVVEHNGNGEPFWDALTSPGTHPSGTSLPPAQANEPSYPVFIDPMGESWLTLSDANKLWVGDTTTGPTRVPRRNMKLVLNSGNPQSLSRRLFSQPDGFSWNEDSQPMSPEVNPTYSRTDMRELRYNALAVIQRPVNRDQFTATLKVVVFLSRRIPAPATGPEVVLPNAATPSVIRFTPGSTQIALSMNADIKKGSWIMDATVQTAAPFIRHANFYRVVSATEDPTAPGFYAVELHTPIKRVDGRNNPATDGYDATVVVLAGVADVFERPVLQSGAAGQ